MSAAVRGSICPLLFTPSVSRMTTLLGESLSFSRFTAVANPLPMAVPSSIMPLSIWFIRFTSDTWSVVMGDWVKASPAKTTRPIRSVGRPMMNFDPISLAAVSRSGVKSRASIDPEMSNAITMSIPSALTFCRSSEDWGRAMAKITRATTRLRSTKGTCLSQ